MSNQNKPRPLRLKKLPKGRFKWKIALQMYHGRSMSSYYRYADESQKLPPDMLGYLHANFNGRYLLHEVRGDFETADYIKYDYLLVEDQFDLMMFKLVFNSLIRQIYTIQVD
jgi:hypothetical protein